MTAWQDQPPLSRRQARRNERGDVVEPLVSVDQLPVEPPAYAGFPGWDAEARRAPAPTPETPVGRRAQRAVEAGPLEPEPLEYITQARPPVPNYDGPSFRPRSAPAAAPEDRQVETPESGRQGYRVRDFSPEGRRSAFTATTPEAPVPDSVWTPSAPSAVPVPLEYHTQGNLPLVPAPIPPQAAPPAQLQQVPVEQTLSRRELRALQQQAEATTAGTDAAFAAPTFAPPAQPSADDRFASALAEFDALSGAAPRVAPADAAPQKFAQPTYEIPELLVPPAPAPAPFDALIGEIPAGPPVSSKPVGHWSTQAEIDDDEQFQENTLSRNIGATSGAITANALVIPSLPSEDALKPFGSTGEILITGTIDLPRSLGSTGMISNQHYDHADVDALLAAGDREDSNPNSAPVRASSAVSTHTSPGGVIGAKPRNRSRLPLVLFVTAATMGVGVIVLFVAGMIFKIF